jgi:hypothetical protein
MTRARALAVGALMGAALVAAPAAAGTRLRMIDPARIAPGSLTGAMVRDGSLTGADLTVARVWGEPSTAGTATAACPAGTQAIGGGFDTAYPYGATRSAPTADGTGWEVQVVNGTMTGWSVRAWVSCL